MAKYDPFSGQSSDFDGQRLSRTGTLKSPRSSIRPDHTMAGNLRRPRITPEGLSYGTRRATADCAREFRIRHHVSAWNFPNRGIHPSLKGSRLACQGRSVLTAVVHRQRRPTESDYFFFFLCGGGFAPDDAAGGRAGLFCCSEGGAGVSFLITPQSTNRR